MPCLSSTSHDAEDADAVAVLALGEVAHVRVGKGRPEARHALGLGLDLGEVPFVVLQVDDDAEGDVRAVRPAQRLAVCHGGEVVVFVVHARLAGCPGHDALPVYSTTWS